MTKEDNSTGISYVIMPMEVLKDENLTPSEKILYCYLTLFKKQCCFQSNAGISSLTGLDESTIKRGLKKLAELKYIFVEFVNNNSAARRIYVIMDNPKKLAYLAKKGAFAEEDKPVQKNAEVPEMPERPRRSHYKTTEDYEKALYNFRVAVV